MTIGDDAGPHGVKGGGRTATGVNGGEGREERPVPPIMAIEMGSGRVIICKLAEVFHGLWSD